MMRFTVALSLIVGLGATTAFAQSVSTIVPVDEADVAALEETLPAGMYPPRDMGAGDPAFASYRARLLLAAKRRDIETVLKLSDPEIHLSFGDDSGREDFRRMLEDRDFPLWATLVEVLENGVWRTEDGMYTAPYWFSMPTEGAYEPFTTAFVPAWGVNVRDAASYQGGVVGVVSYGFVSLTEPYVGGSESGFMAVRTADGVEGFIHASFLRGMVAHRAGFVKGDDGWRMTFFIAGD